MPTGMNCRRSASSYGFAQSMSERRYGLTRTLIGDFANPTFVSSRKSGSTSPFSASISLSTRVIECFACQL